jgi:hypothetical protein
LHHTSQPDPREQPHDAVGGLYGATSALAVWPGVRRSDPKRNQVGFVRSRDLRLKERILFDED